MQQSTLCQPDVVHGLNVDVPQQTVRCRQRPSDTCIRRRLWTVASSSDEYDGLNALLVAPVVLPTKPRGLDTQRRAYHILVRQKRENFWTQKIDAERSCPLKRRRSVDALMCRGRVSASDLISVTEYNAFFDGKVADVRATTADATPATYTSHLHLLTAHCPSFDHWTSLTSSRLSSCCPTCSALLTQCQRGY